MQDYTDRQNCLEDKRLSIRKLFLKKQHSQIDLKLKKNYFETCKFLDKINARTKASYSVDNPIFSTNISIFDKIETNQNKRVNYFMRNSSSRLDDKSELSTSFSSFSSHSSCSSYAPSLVKSYTSLENFKNDRKMIHGSDSSNILETNTEGEICAVIINNFQNNVSIRRSLIQKKSVQHFESQIKALEKKANYFKKMNQEKFTKTNRNINYGSQFHNKKKFNIS